MLGQKNHMPNSALIYIPFNPTYVHGRHRMEDSREFVLYTVYVIAIISLYVLLTIPWIVKAGLFY